MTNVLAANDRCDFNKQAMDESKRLELTKHVVLLDWSWRNRAHPQPPDAWSANRKNGSAPRLHCARREQRPLYVRVSPQYPALIKPPLPEFPRFNDIVSPACLSLGQARRDACCDQEWDGMP